MTDGETKQMLAAMLEVKKCKTSEALGQVRDLANEQYKAAANREANQMGWFVGQKVKMKSHLQQRKPYDALGTVRSVNRVNLVVAFEGMPTYNVKKTALQEVI